LYVAVLRRHESLAVNMGAKLVGPLMFKSLEKLFEGPIKMTGGEAHPPSVTWLDIVELARHKPNAFQLATTRNGSRSCQVWIQDTTCEISEDDYRLILTGNPARMIPIQPITEDENSELATIEILEQRLAILIKRADLIAGQARLLNRSLKGRRSAMQASRAPDQATSTPPGSERQSTNFQTFQPVNHRSAADEKSALHQDLLRQFLADDRLATSSRHRDARRHSSESSAVGSPNVTGLAGISGVSSTPDPARSLFQIHNFSTPDDGSGGSLRPHMHVRVEKLERGTIIYPPCDRCRRLRIDCTKHLTACGGCTKKHARCTWRDITEAETKYVTCTPPIGNDATYMSAPISSAQEYPILATQGINLLADGGLPTSTKATIGPEHTSLNAFLDPGLRGNGSLESITRAENVEAGGILEHDEGRSLARRDQLSAEHALGHMASAATAAKRSSAHSSPAGDNPMNGSTANGS
jgi:hypothetical protein